MDAAKLPLARNEKITNRFAGVEHGRVWVEARANRGRNRVNGQGGQNRRGFEPDVEGETPSLRGWCKRITNGFTFARVTPHVA